MANTLELEWLGFFMATGSVQFEFYGYIFAFQLQFSSVQDVASSSAQFPSLLLGRSAPTWFMISDQLNLDQELNRVHVVLHCTNLNSGQLIWFS